MGTARVPRLPAGLPSTAPPGTGGTGADCTLPWRPRTATSQTPAGDIPRGRVRSAPAGDSPRVRRPDSRPRRRRTSPPATTWVGALAPATRLASPPAAGTPSSQQPRADHRQKQAAPHLRCGTAGVGAPVQARCSLSGDESSRHPSGTPTSARGHRTSSFGGILLPDPPS